MCLVWVEPDGQRGEVVRKCFLLLKFNGIFFFKFQLNIEENELYC